jgi:acyl-coenzyme A thioesterase PaaI-like protein
MLVKETALVRLLGLAKIPMLFYVGPQVLELDDRKAVIKIPLGYRTRNHVGAMYFGALAAGADCAGGLLAMKLVRSEYRRHVVLFKDLRADFLKRADGDVVFRSDDGPAVREAFVKADRTGERVTIPVSVTATVPEKYGDDPVARFTLGFSVKKK